MSCWAWEMVSSIEALVQEAIEELVGENWEKKNWSGASWIKDGVKTVLV